LYIINCIKEEIKIDLLSFNDYELFYLISIGSEEALEILYAKYSILISKKIREFHFYKDKEDIFQESLFVLFKAIKRYNEDEYPFFFYFYTALVNRLKTLKKDEIRHSCVEVSDSLLELKDKHDSVPLELYEYDIFESLTDLEKTYLHLRFMKKWTIKQIASNYKMKEMKVYYIISKARIKVKKRATDLGYI